MKHLRENLAKLGLTGRKGEVYLACLQVGSGTVLEIAIEARIKRTTASDILEELLCRKLVTQSYRGNKRIFTAAPPSSLRVVPDEQLSVIDAMLPDLNAYYNASPSKPGVHYYSGLEGLRQGHEVLLQAGVSDYYYFGTVEDYANALGRDYLDDYVRRRIDAGIWSNGLRVREQELAAISSMHPGDHNLRRVRYLPDSFPGPANGVHVAGKHVVITSTRDECYTLVVESTGLANAIQGVWNMLWEVSTPAPR